MNTLQLIQTELKAPKNLKNSFGNYNYRNVESIFEAVKPLLKKHEATLIVSDEILQVGDRFYIKATATLTDKGGASVSVSALAREALTKKGMDDAQITGSASSYARKYALGGLFLLDDNKDPDSGEQPSGGEKTKAELGKEAAANVYNTLTNMGMKKEEIKQFMESKGYKSSDADAMIALANDFKRLKNEATSFMAMATNQDAQG